MQRETVGRVLAMAVRHGPKGPMVEIGQAIARLDGCLDGDGKHSPHRGVTLLASRQWQAVIRELGVDLPWHTRRANVLIEADRLGHLIGKVVQIGRARLTIHGETAPCALMDRLCPGLRAALVPDCRGGVHGRVIEAGEIRLGDELAVCDAG